MQSVNLANIERMFGLLDKVPAIQDTPQASDVVPTKGELSFNGVCFNYDERICDVYTFS